MANRALLGHLEHPFASGAPFFAHFDDRRDDLARFFDHDDVPDANVFPRDFLFVVQGGAGDGAAADEHRFQFRDGREHTGAAHLHGDLQQARFRLLGLVLIRHCPAWGFGSKPGCGPLRKGIGLDHRAVGLEREIVPDGPQGVNGFEHFISRARGPGAVVDGQSARGQLRQRLLVGLPRGALHDAGAVKNRPQAAFGDDGGVELLQGASGSVARVRKRRFACFGAFFVDFGKPGFGKINLAANLQ